MGRLIDADKFEAFILRTNGDEEFVNGVQYVLERIDNAPTVEAIPKDQYEARLKADMVDMLEELKTEIEKIEKYDTKNLHYDKLQIASGYNCGLDDCVETIQEKIDALKVKGGEKE